ncbi:MAG TPA: hypothetical protein VMS31_16780, partial [Pyrinomonadaceae bacterium]|nr:hypothetical protein [Pyrinomonadaceae bacterium]
MKFVAGNAESRVCVRIVVLVCACLIASVANGQSPDVAAPSPVRSNEVTGTIGARDIGDPRLTDHYYA